MKTTDIKEVYNNAPEIVKNLINSYQNECDYISMSELQDKLKELGYYMDYNLEGEIIELRDNLCEVTIKNIDPVLLRAQKESLLKIQADLEGEEWETIEGMINLCEAILDKIN